MKSTSSSKNKSSKENSLDPNPKNFIIRKNIIRGSYKKPGALTLSRCSDTSSSEMQSNTDSNSRKLIQFYKQQIIRKDKLFEELEEENKELKELNKVLIEVIKKDEEVNKEFEEQNKGLKELNKNLKEVNNKIKARMISLEETVKRQEEQFNQIITLLKEKESQEKYEKLVRRREESSDGVNKNKDSTERNYEDKDNQGGDKGELTKKKKSEKEEVKFMKEESKKRKNKNIDKEVTKEKDQNERINKESDGETESISEKSKIITI